MHLLSAKLAINKTVAPSFAIKTHYLFATDPSLGRARKHRRSTAPKAPTTQSRRLSSSARLQLSTATARLAEALHKVAAPRG